jgi:hypothetical protein
MPFHTPHPKVTAQAVHGLKEPKPETASAPKNVPGAEETINQPDEDVDKTVDDPTQLKDWQDRTWLTISRLMRNISAKEGVVEYLKQWVPGIEDNPEVKWVIEGVPGSGIGDDDTTHYLQNTDLFLKIVHRLETEAASEKINLLIGKELQWVKYLRDLDNAFNGKGPYTPGQAESYLGEINDFLTYERQKEAYRLYREPA